MIVQTEDIEQAKKEVEGRLKDLAVLMSKFSLGMTTDGEVFFYLEYKKQDGSVHEIACAMPDDIFRDLPKALLEMAKDRPKPKLPNGKGH